MSKWTFLTNHALVFIFLANHPKITARDLSMAIGITERAIRNIIADLDKDNYIEKIKEGRRVRYKINSKLPFRHHTQQDKAIEKLLGALGSKPKKNKSTRRNDK